MNSKSAEIPCVPYSAPDDITKDFNFEYHYYEKQPQHYDDAIRTKLEFKPVEIATQGTFGKIIYFTNECTNLPESKASIC